MFLICGARASRYASMSILTHLATNAPRQKIMQDHNVTPEWIAAGKSLAQNETQLRNEVGSSAQRYTEELAAAKLSALRRDTSKRWSRYVANFQKRVERHNREVLLYNLKAPKGIAHKQVLDGETLIQRALQSSKQKAVLE